jgi:ferredoxin
LLKRGDIFMTANNESIRDAALRLGYIDAMPATGHPFDVWHSRWKDASLGPYMASAYDPASSTGWPLHEITIWAAIAPTPPFAEWLDGCGEIGAFYMCAKQRDSRRAAWEDAAAAMGYEIKHGAILPERAAAIRAGLGVHGLSGLLIAPGYGSYVDITLLLVHAAPPPGARGPEYDLSPGCRRCGKCIKACPTGAISDNGVDTRICLRSYMNRLNDLPEEDYPKMGRRILGCETCQQACPCNASLKRGQPPADIVELTQLDELLSIPNYDKISNYVNLYEPSVKPMASLAAANSGDKSLLPLIEGIAAGSNDATLAKMAGWAAKQLRQPNNHGAVQR